MVNVNRTFSRLVFLQIMMGTLAFCLASRDVGMLLIVGALGTVAWFVVERRGGKPMPQWIVGSGAIVASAWLVLAIFDQRDEPVRAMGNFIMWLQLLLLFGKKSNREYAELLVLSLMLMVGATTINQAIIFGALLVVYYTLALFTLLTFQFKVLSDRVTRLRAAGVADQSEDHERDLPVSSGFRWQFRTMAMTMGMVAACVGVVVFLRLPRSGTSGGSNDRLAALQQQREVDFSPQINLDEPLPETASRDPVMNVTITVDGRPYGGADQPQHIRGAALDRYDVIRRTWSADPRTRVATARYAVPRSGAVLVPLPRSTQMMEARFTLRARSPRTLFSLFPPASVESDFLTSVQFNTLDQTISAVERPDGAIEYVVSTPVVLPVRYFSSLESPDMLDPPPSRRDEHAWERYTPLATSVGEIGDWVWPQDDDILQDYYPSAEAARDALRHQLTMVDQPGSVADFWRLQFRALAAGAVDVYRIRNASRFFGMNSLVGQPSDGPATIDVTEIINQDTRQWVGYARGWPVDAEAVRGLAEAILIEARTDQTNDLQIARALTNYVRENFSYSLSNNHDTTGRDPTVAFLFDHRKGHCELFASGLAALARARGMRARVVTGYLATEYVGTGGYYIVRKSDAHAWTEIYCEGIGWRPFDATPSSDILAERAPASVLSWLTDMYDHIEFAWIGSIVTYDSRTRSGMLDSINNAINDTLMGDKSWLSENMAKLDKAIEDAATGSWSAVLALAGLVVGSLFAIYVLYRVMRWLIGRTGNRGRSSRRREELPAHAQFYPRMLTMLAAVGHVRPDWQTPLAFARDLAGEDASRFGPVERLTRQFYELYYGGRPMDDDRRAAIDSDMSKLQAYLRQQLPESRA